MEQIYRSLQDQAYLDLQKMIMNEELDAGVIYSETKMAQQMNISRTPFRAALVRLSQDKYIDIIPSKGFRVHVPNEEDIRTTFQIRTAVESFCAVLLASQKETEEAARTIRSMQETLKVMQDCIDEGDASFQSADRRFHRELLTFSHNEEFLKLYDYSIYHQIVTVSRKRIMSAAEKEQTCMEHAAITAAVQEGSVEKCYLAVSRHMQTNRDNSLNQLKNSKTALYSGAARSAASPAGPL